MRHRLTSVLCRSAQYGSPRHHPRSHADLQLQLTCLLNTFAAANCSITDVDCQCHNDRLVDDTTACMLSNCTLADSLGTWDFDIEKRPTVDQINSVRQASRAGLRISAAIKVTRHLGSECGSLFISDFGSPAASALQASHQQDHILR